MVLKVWSGSVCRSTVVLPDLKRRVHVCGEGAVEGMVCGRINVETCVDRRGGGSWYFT